ncbi:restriction endonuclease [Lentzea sp. NPDC051213]|uniref:restriction endonuclease n=1 Tax=Lentzea sp. NPDC051213 TaxID=3364126 RepID=UPI003799B903
MVELRPPFRQINSWQVAEENAAAWMRHFGYRGVQLTASGADGGVDVCAYGALAQVKFEARQVGRPQLQNLVGARGRDYAAELLFFTGAGYTNTAVVYADDMNIALFTYLLDGAVIPTNAAAARVMSRAAGLAVGEAASPASVAAQTRLTVASRRSQPGGVGATVGLLTLGALFTWALVMGALKPENWHGDGPLGGAVILLLAVVCLTFGVRRLLRYFS